MRVSNHGHHFCCVVQDKRTDLDPRLAAKLSDPAVEDFFTVMAICNSVVVSTSSARNGNGNGVAVNSLQNGSVPELKDATNPDSSRLNYEAESPDEAALVHVCD